MKLKKYGAMVPMARGARTEHLIVYFCNDWEELVCLLEAPLEYLRGQQFLWQQPAEESISWQLLTPLTATIECAFRDYETISESLSLMMPALAASNKNFSIDKTPGFNSASTADTLRRFGMAMRGSFLVEFATYTNAIRILYFPPKIASGSTPRYTAGYMNPVLMSTGVGSFMHANVHFDLNENTSRMRADFIVGLLEQPDSLAQELTEMARNQSMYRLDYELDQAKMPKSPMRAVPQNQRQAMDPQITFVPGLAPGISTDKGTLERVFRGFRRFPTVIAHNLSEVTAASVCSVIKCPTRSGNSIGMGLVTVESYFRMLYDPQSVIERYA